MNGYKSMISTRSTGLALVIEAMKPFHIDRAQRTANIFLVLRGRLWTTISIDSWLNAEVVKDQEEDPDLKQDFE